VANNISSASINCLQFTAGPVTLDLNGFTVSGSGATNGVVASGVASVTVRNGTIKGFARSIYATGAGAVIDGVRALTGTNANGITVGAQSTVENCLGQRPHGGRHPGWQQCHDRAQYAHRQYRKHDHCRGLQHR
jgi:hypothetical protein